jgi:hypothetical protein
MSENHFRRFAALGYTRLVPIVPPDAKISDKSTLAKRKDARGKAVGVKRRDDGLWCGFDWLPYEADETDYDRWHGMGAGVGIKTGQGLLAIDADTLIDEHARTIRDTAERYFGRTPVRVGRYPKALYLIRVSEEYRYTRVDFGDRDERGNIPNRIEILSDGRQFVAHGIHPSTGNGYYWPREIVPLDDLPTFPPETIDAFMRELRSILPKAQELVKEGAQNDINQDALKGDPKIVTRAVKAMANTSEHFPTRENYRDVGYAIKGALQDNPQLAFDLFADWCAKWADGTNDPDVVASDWSRMKGPFKVGAGKLYELAEMASAGKFTVASVWFDDIDEADKDNPFAEIEAKRQKEEQPDPIQQAADAIHATSYSFPDPTTITPRQWLYANHYIRKFVSATVAPSGVGKSSLEIAEALVMASGKPLLGKQPTGQFRVWLWNGEDPRDELDRRIAAAMLHYGLSRDDIGDRLFVDSGRDMEIVLATEGKDGARIMAPIVGAVTRAIKENKIDVLQIDPFVSSHRVSENDNGAIDLVTKQWSKIADQCNCAIELVHHVRKLNGAEITVEDSRGAVSLIATSRSARALTKMTTREAGLLGLENHWRYFRFGDGKNNLAPPVDSETEWMELRSVGLGNGLIGESISGISHSANEIDREMRGDWVGVVCRVDGLGEATVGASSGTQGEALRLIEEGEWRRDIRAGDAWAGVPIGRAMGLDYTDEVEKGRVKAILTSWIKAGLLVEVSRKDSARRPRTFVEVAKRTDKLSENLFD